MGEATTTIFPSPACTSVVRGFIPTYASAPPIVILGQQWPCWLSTALSLRLQILGGFFASRFHRFFEVPDTLKLTFAWSTFDQLLPFVSTTRGAALLASGSLTFLSTLELLCVGHVGTFLYAVDTPFACTRLQDATHLHRSVAMRKVHNGFDSFVVRHSNYGGATTAVHLLLLWLLSGCIIPPRLPCGGWSSTSSITPLMGDLRLSTLPALFWMGR